MSDNDKFRLDKWLWAARFFKTRGLAVDAIDGGKVRVDGLRAKASKELRLGNEVRVTREDGEWTVIVRGLSLQRRPAAEAVLLYEETEESKTRRLALAEQRKAEYGERERGAGRPTKRDRRLIHRFTDDY
ncbi:ribosome-associated heat shock protein Hsp15 [Novimethylophilus kurashikiensis]|uniref:Ribosome-associated heat shock protein Hsp15 n=1 Tax=Novimethylophilus kurashikiensis TaxID=1825523 RepID=A0A2R5FA43_9PROT|nr:S4 domain-containing protein [Novimethylophilus kurashikiensis]GBG15067.1 ribosome-associated heat shock protein Hsp15 [Novimethylophilus kurashikiensis]